MSIDLNVTQKEIVQDIKSAILKQEHNQFFLSEEIRIKAIEIANITPEVDFINLFVNIDAVVYLQKSGEICFTCIADLENLGDDDNTDDPPISYLPNCDCRWTCSQEALEPCTRVTSKCNHTSGCGFLGFQACTGTVVDSGLCGN